MIPAVLEHEYTEVKMQGGEGAGKREKNLRTSQPHSPLRLNTKMLKEDGWSATPP